MNKFLISTEGPKALIIDINPTKVGSSVKSTCIELRIYNPFRTSFLKPWFLASYRGGGMTLFHFCGVRVVYTRNYYYSFPYMHRRFFKVMLGKS